MAVVRAIEGLRNIQAPARIERKSLFGKVKDKAVTAWNKFKDFFKPSGCQEIENRAKKVCIAEAVNLKLKCDAHCQTKVDPRTGKHIRLICLIVCMYVRMCAFHRSRTHLLAFQVHKLALYNITSMRISYCIYVVQTARASKKR
jgi:hypothetical protein